VTGEVGWIYTLHLHAPLGTTGRNSARHYTGWATRGGLLRRLESHRSTYADAAMMRWCAQTGIGWHLGGLALGTRADERKAKQHGAARRCWTCQAAAHA
jgi:hypothetical protein